MAKWRKLPDGTRVPAEDDETEVESATDETPNDDKPESDEELNDG